MSMTVKQFTNPLKPSVNDKCLYLFSSEVFGSCIKVSSVCVQ